MQLNTFPLAPTGLNDDTIELEIIRLQRAIEAWVKSHDLWYDCGFKSYLDHFDARPWTDHPVVTIFASDGDFNRIFDGTEELYNGFTSLLDQEGYWFERDTGLVYIYAEDSTKNELFKDYFHWQWICSLVRPDFSDLYQELFQHFCEKPEHFLKLDWWDFQVLVYEALRGLGFRAELGPVSGDGGIDIKMFQRDPLGDVLTAVQVKRYRPDRKIKLEAVQALHGAKVAENMQNSMFVTTSDYFPSSKKFAARKNVSMQLYASSDVREWCQQAAQGIIEDKAALISRDNVEKKLLDATWCPEGQIVHAHIGYTISMNSFALILKETRHAALLMELPKRVVSHDGYGQRGSEVPLVDISAAVNHRKQSVYRAKKSAGNGQDIHLWTGDRLYSAWDGKPIAFDYCD